MKNKNYVYYLKISLLHIEPPIWRRFVVPGNITLPELHQVIQTVMGWLNKHLHLFRIEDKCFSLPDPDGDILHEDDYNELEAVLSDVVKTAGMDFSYLYDFGDDWDHTLTVEKISPPERDLKYPVCLAGERSCPPEDCLGPPGYMDFLEAILNPHHKNHKQMIEWFGGDFNSEGFDLKAINDELEDLGI